MPPRIEFPFLHMPRRIPVPRLPRSSFRPQIANFHYSRRILIPADPDSPKTLSKSTEKSRDLPVVRYYEQDPYDDESKPVRVSDKAHPEALEGEAMLEEIHRLEDRLKKFEESFESGESLLEGLSEEDRMEVINAIQERKDEFRNMRVSVLEPESREVPPILKRLNRLIRIVSMDEDEDRPRKNLWKMYLVARQHPEIMQAIPDAAWDLIWRSQTTITPTNPHGATHATIIAEDMDRAGRHPTIAQRITQIESLFLEGSQDEAIQRWEEEFRAVGGHYGEDIKPEFLDIGIRMFAETGAIAQARRLLRQLLMTFPDHGVRSVIPLIVAHVTLGCGVQNAEAGSGAVESRDNEHLQQAWALYQLLRSHFSSKMTMEDYDAIYVCFLSFNLKDAALEIFRDMMLSKRSVDDTEAEILPKQLAELRELSDDAAFFNKVNLTSLGALPSHLSNKFFFASWAKKLIGMDELHAASQVFELMWERNIPPDAMHLNGLISGWLRSNNSDLVQKAEQMAWTMVGRRIEHGYRKRAKARGEDVYREPSISVTEDGVRIPAFLQRPVRMATRETFNLLLHHYLRENNQSLRTHVKNMIRVSETPLNTKFMNDTVWSCLYCRDPQEAWNEYKYWSKNIRPNMDTWLALSQCLQDLIERQNYQTQWREELNPRILFSKMESWFTTLSDEEAEKMADYFRNHSATDATRVPYEDMIQPFCLTMDLPGIIVAMHRLRDLFGAFPDERTARKITLMVARSKLPLEKTPRRRRAITKTPQNQRNVERVSKILQNLFEQQQQTAQERGVDLASIDSQARAEMNLSLFTELIMVALRQEWHPEQIQGGLEKARFEMSANQSN